jgi:transglutaminase-like putative cysteine protease
MKKLIPILFIFVYSIQATQAQENFQNETVSPVLMKNANSVILNHETEIKIHSFNEMQIFENREILVINEKGFNDIDAFEHYDEVTDVKNLEVFIYDANGSEIEKFRKKDFKDVSAVSSGTMYSDSRVFYLEYTPISYPIKVKYSSEVSTSNTAIIRHFHPISNYKQSVKDYSFKIINNSDSELRFHKNEYVLENVIEEINGNTYSFSVENLKALEYQSYSPSLRNFTPNIMFGLSKFELEGVYGEATDWATFGKWQNENLLKGLNELPVETVNTIKEKVANLETVEEKARAIYEYVQDNTRYISLQIGIGGWKPIAAKIVDESKYGDCKALTHYTKSLLEVVGIESDYCVVQSGSEISDIEADFASMQGNHVILHIPQENEAGYWLECTNQKIPFNFLGTFTDNRNVLAIGSQESNIIKTPAYIEEDNHQFTHAKIKVLGSDLAAEINIESKGTQYQSHYALADADDKSVRDYYNNYWSNLKRFNLNEYKFNNDKNKVQFSETIEIDVQNYIKKYGNDLIFEVNPFNQITFDISDSEERTNPFLVSRGFVDEDIFEFHLGELTVESIPENITLESKFGVYKLHFKVENSMFIVNRYLKLNKNDYEKSDYSEFVKFTNQIENYDQTKASFKS